MQLQQLRRHYQQQQQQRWASSSRRISLKLPWRMAVAEATPARHLPSCLPPCQCFAHEQRWSLCPPHADTAQ